MTAVALTVAVVVVSHQGGVGDKSGGVNITKGRSEAIYGHIYIKLTGLERGTRLRYL